MSNLHIYNAVRSVPVEAKKAISGGRLNGKTDINPMWRIKSLTEQFGPCGFGWRYEITDKRLEKGFGDEVAAFVDINLYVKVNGEWSEAIPGTGGAAFVAKEKAGPYTSDECYKMALTDALSVACKALGVGADVYWDKDASKYDKPQETPPQAAQAPVKPQAAPTVTPEDLQPIYNAVNGPDGKPDPAQVERFKSIYSRYGYKKATEIKRSDIQKITDEFVECALPFELG